MANAGEVSVALNLDDADFLAGLEAARISLEDFSREIAQLARPPELSIDELTSVPDDNAAFAQAGTQAGLAYNEALASALRTDTLAQSSAQAGADAASALTDALIAGLSDTAALMWQTGAQSSQSLAEGLMLGQPQLSAAASSLMQAALNAAGACAPAAEGIGINFASGLASGIRAGSSGVISAAIAVAEAAADAARGALAIHSPSRVTEKLGKFFDMGFIEGVEGMTADIERSVRAAVQLSPPSPSAVIDAAPAQPVQPVQPIDYDALADAMNQRNMVLTMKDRAVAEVLTNETARTQARRNRRVALGYGK